MPGSPAPEPSYGSGGLIVIMRPDPVTAARALADEHGVEVTTGGLATIEAIARLLERTGAHRGPASADQTGGAATAIEADISRRVDEVDQVRVAASAPVRRPTIAELDDLGAKMRRADDLRDRTRQRIADELCQSLNSSLAIHPDTLRQAATELIDAMHATTQARTGRLPGAKQTRVAPAGTVGAVGVVGAAATALGVVVAWPAGLALAGVGAVSGIARQRTIRRTARQALPSLESAEALARRRWERVAGNGADPTDLEAVIRRYDPHTDVVGELLGHHPAVRAAQRVADERRQAWVEAWQVAVDDPLVASAPPDQRIEAPTPPSAPSPPEVARPVDAAAAVESRADTVGRADGPGPTVEVGAAAANESGDGPVAPGVLVVVSPYHGLTEVEAHDLHDRLLDLPVDVEVIVVLGNDVLDQIGGVGGLAASASATEDDRRQERVIDLTSRSSSSSSPAWSDDAPAAPFHAPSSASVDSG